MDDSEIVTIAAPVAFVSVKSDRVVGRMASTNGTVSLRTVIEFATKLVLAGIASTRESGYRVEERGCFASKFFSAPCHELYGKAVVMHTNQGEEHWQVTITDETAAVIASVNLDYNVSKDNIAKEEKWDAPVQTSQFSDVGPEQTQSEKRREHIASVAADVIAKKGFANSTMREIADAAGMHVPTMYQYVASKDEMLELVYSWLMATVRTDVEAATQHYATATEKVRATIEATTDKGDRFRRHIGVLNRELRSLSPQARTRVLAEYRRLILQIASLVEEGVASGEFRNVEPEIVANLIDGACDMWALRQFALGQYGVDAYRREISDLIIAALRK